MRYLLIVFLSLFFSCAGSLYVEKDKTGIEGTVVSVNNMPESDVYVYLYRSISSGLIGPSDFMEKTDEKGYFYFDVPEGKYYIIARKRIKGGDAGPLREGDRSAIYNKNPVEVKPNHVSNVKIILPPSSSLFQKKMPLGDIEITIKLKGNLNKRLKLLVYEGEDIKRSPSYIIDIQENEKVINLYRGKRYIIVLREGLKEKVGETEFFKIYGPFLSDTTSVIEFDL
ncbi:MAG: hypothetical protein N2999_06445 [Proteobacteria bacterium]|nr:hypothetical protein [Pseudomonadota bacterium]